MLLAGLGSVRIGKICDLGLENAALGLRPRAAFSNLKLITCSITAWIVVHSVQLPLLSISKPYSYGPIVLVYSDNVCDSEYVKGIYCNRISVLQTE